MDAIIYLFVLAGRSFVHVLRDVYHSLWQPVTAFGVLFIAYVLFEILSIMNKSLEAQIENDTTEARLMIQDRLLVLERRLSAIENQLDRIERHLGK